MINYNYKDHKRPQVKQWSNLVFPSWALPGGWDTLEVETSAKEQSTSYFMWGKLHPKEGPYEDFWGVKWPLGHRIILRIVEFKSAEESAYRFSVCSSRHCNKHTTKRFQTLEEAMEYATKEMIATTRKFDKIHSTTTPIWDTKEINNNDLNFNTEQ